MKWRGCPPNMQRRHVKKRNKPYKPRYGRRKAEQPDIKDAFAPGEQVRLNRFIARCGVCSRREADTLISEGHIAVNGQTVTEMGTQVTTKDIVEVHGRRIVPVGLTYIILNKPTNTITTTDDERDRRSVMDLLELPEEDASGLFPVGRLDRNTTGVLLITSDGDLAHRLMHPSYEIDKVYVVDTKEDVTDGQVEKLTSGIALDDGPAKAEHAALVDPQSRRRVAISIHEGRNRQVRRMFESLGLTVSHLERVQYAGLTTDGVRRGKWRRLSRDEVASLYRKVKL